MFNCWADIFDESECKFPSLSSFTFSKENFKIASRHEFHYNRKLILDGDAFNHFHDFWVLCLPADQQNITYHNPFTRGENLSFQYATGPFLITFDVSG